MLLRNAIGQVVVSFAVLNAFAKDLRLIFWIDPLQRHLYEDISKSLQDLAALQLDVQTQHAVIEVDNEADDDAAIVDDFCAALRTIGVSLVLDFTYNKWHAGYEMIERFGIPYLRLERILSPFLQALQQFAQQKGGNEIVMLFENSQARDEALYHIIEGYEFRTLLLSVSEDTDYVESIGRLRPSPTYLAIFAAGPRMNGIFEKVFSGVPLDEFNFINRNFWQIREGGLFARPREWHFVFLDGRDRAFKYKKQVEYANKLTFNTKSVCKTLGMPESYCASGFSWQRALLLEIFRKLPELPGDALRSLAVDCNMTGDTLRRNAQWDVMDLLDLSEFLRPSNRPDIFQDRLPDPITYAVNISMSFYSNAHEAYTDLAVWQSGQLIKLNETISKPKRFLRVGVTEAFPWNFYVRDPVTGNITLDAQGKPMWQGYCIDLIETLSRKMYFDYELIAPIVGKFGKRDPRTGQWDGIIGDLVRGETNFAATALKMYTDREEVIDFIAPYFETTGISIVIRKPLRQTSLFKFMTVLRVEVWFSIVAALVSTAVLLWFLDKYSPYSYRNNKERYEYPCREFTLRECFWFALTSFTPQGGGEAPKAVSGRVLVAAYWLFVVLMLATFTANLAAFLTVERMQAPVQSLEQLSRQSRINYTVVEGSDVHQYFINMKFAEDTLYRMWKEAALNESENYHKFRVWDYPIKEQYGNILTAINNSIPVQNAAEGFRKVSAHINGDFAFIHDSSEIKYELTRNCNLTEIGEVFGEQPYAVAIQQGSNLGDELIYSLLELQKDHYFEELKAKYWNYSNLQCPLTEEQEGISLDSLGGVFIATLFGLGVAMLTLLCEILYYKKKERQFDKLKHRRPSVLMVEPARRSSSATPWHTGGTLVDKTPPPSFDVATFRGRPVPANVTLGSDEFKPRRFTRKSRKPVNYDPDQHELPPYID